MAEVLSDNENIHHISQHLIGVQGAVNNLTKQNAAQTKDIAEIKAQGKQIFEAIGGNEELGHNGLAQQIRDQNEAIEIIHNTQLSFREKYEKEKAVAGKRWGFLTGLAVVFGIFGKWILLKIGLVL